MKITLIIDSLTGGGAQRAAILLAEGLIARKHQVSLVTLFGQELDFYQLPETINRIALKVAGESSNLIQAAKNNLHRWRYLRQAIDSLQPDLVISFLDKTNILTLIACWGSKYPILVSEQNDPTQNDIGRPWSWLRRLVYPSASQVISCSQGVDNNWDWLKSDRRTVIYNPLAVVAESSTNTELPEKYDPEQKTVVAMGRLTEQKGFDLLLDAFASIALRHSDWQLLILGEGEQRQKLEAQRDRLGLKDRLIMPGLISNPFPILKRCHLFVLSSRYEGFGNVIIEAMACDLPVISTDCPSGPGEIITNEENGILVPNRDRDSLAKAMTKLMSDPARRMELAATARKSLKRFELDTIVSQWEDLLTATAKSKSTVV
ncbi:MAG: glycosyltransferase family 4 protein [Pleurocapsa sp. MO_192.B19]|nr:glycosyltransferase family 4 protein [Pleurocapsa sp. MO_192.B19]